MNFSVVIPTHNRPLQLCYSLLNLVKIISSYKGGSIEILIVDNSTKSKDSIYTIELIKNITHFRRIKYFFEEKIGPTFTRNKGCRHAKYNNVVFVDDDVFVTCDLFNLLYKDLNRKNNIALIGGKICGLYLINKPYNGIYSKYPWILAEIDLGNKKRILKYPEIIYSACMYLNRDLLGKEPFSILLGKKRHGALIFGEDNELCIRLHSENKIILYDSRIKSINMVLEDRFKYLFVLKRLYSVGIQTRILDELYINNYKKYMPYKSTLPSLFYRNFFRNLISIEFWLNIVEKVVHDLGYLVGIYYA